jgi:hypothetical protein
VPEPVRVSTPRDAGVRDLPNDWSALTQLYTQQLLPEALQADRELIAAMQRVVDFKPPADLAADLAAALEAATCDSERCYILDLLRETQYLSLRAELRNRSSQRLAPSLAKDTRNNIQERIHSEAAWDLATTLSRLDTAYGEGRYHDAAELLVKLAADKPQ